jgi:hypothetical protein
MAKACCESMIARLKTTCFVSSIVVGSQSVWAFAIKQMHNEQPMRALLLMQFTGRCNAVAPCMDLESSKADEKKPGSIRLQVSQREPSI